MQTRKKKDPHVRKIKTKADIKKAVTAPKLFCRYKMNSCGHCINSQADWDKLEEEVKGNLKPGCMVCEVESALVDSFNMKDGFKPEGFPTHAVFLNGHHVENAEDRSFHGLMQTLRKHDFLKNQAGGKRKRNRQTRRR